MIYDLTKISEAAAKNPSDINEHIGTIIKYGRECETITEMGVRGIVSTWGWLEARPRKLTCYDIVHPQALGADLQSVYDTAAHYGIEFSFIEADVLSIEIEETDLLFIDTLHNYKQLKQELALHASKVKKYICFHDTTTFRYVDEVNYGNEPKRGLWPAIEEFLEDHKNWQIKERFTNNNGFTVLEKIK